MTIRSVFILSILLTTGCLVVVCLILAIISALTIYMLFLLLLEPLLSARRSGPLTAGGSDLHGKLGEGLSNSVTTSRLGRSRWSFVGSLHGLSGSSKAPTTTTVGGSCNLPQSSTKVADMAVSWNRSRLSTKQFLHIERLSDAHPASDVTVTPTQLRQRPSKPGLLLSPGTHPTSILPTSAEAPTVSVSSSFGHPPGVSTVVRTVRNQQQRWKGNVEAQRARVFSEHTLLN